MRYETMRQGRSTALVSLEQLYAVCKTSCDRISLRGRRLTSINNELNYIRSHFPQLEHLDLSENSLVSLPQRVFSESLPRLVSLDLRRNRFQSITDLSEELALLPSLRRLSITLRNKVEEKVILMRLPKLRFLNESLAGSTSQCIEVPSIPSSPTSPWIDTSIHDEDSALLLPAERKGNTYVADGTGGNTEEIYEDVEIDEEERESEVDDEEAQDFTEQRGKNNEEYEVEAGLEMEQEDEEEVEVMPIPTPHEHPNGNSSMAWIKWQSVRPTEMPATISDEKTDWRKLLKKEDNCLASPIIQQRLPPPSPTSHIQQEETNTKIKSDGIIIKNKMEGTRPKRKPLQLENSSTVQQPLIYSPPANLTETRSFVVELRDIIKTLHQTAPSGPQTANLLTPEQIDRRVDQVARQLDIMEKRRGENNYASKTEIQQQEINSLTARWCILMELSGLYATQKASATNRALGAGVERLLHAQRRVVDALLQHTQDAIQLQHASDQGQVQSTEHQESQITVLLEVAETLERDLKSLSKQYEEEKIKRIQMETENQSLKQKWETLDEKRTTQAHNSDAVSKRQPPSTNTLIDRLSQPRYVVSRRSQQLDQTTPSRRVRKRVVVENFSDASSVPTSVRALTLKQLVDLIRCIFASKIKYDARTKQVGAPPETMEQHMYTYLNQRFGLQQLTIEYACALWKGCQLYTRQDNDVASFHALLRNEVDEDFLIIRQKLQQALRDLLRAYLHAKYPMKSEAILTNMVQSRVQGFIEEQEWNELLVYLYDSHDSSILMRLVKRKAESTSMNQAQPLQVSFVVFEKLLCDYQLQGRLKMLEEFRTCFHQIDPEHLGVVTREKYYTLVQQLTPWKTNSEIQSMVSTIDPFEHDAITFSNAVRSLLSDIRQHRIACYTSDSGSAKEDMSPTHSNSIQA